MSLTGYQWAITVTHEPTGISKTITNRDIRSQHKARELAIKLVKSKVHYMKTIGMIQNEVVKSYILADSYPEDWEHLMDVRID